jgi:hypothetical protein
MPFAKRYAPTTLNDYIYTAVGAETSVSGADDNGDTLSYNPATVRVFLDGVRLDPADFTATNSTSITGLTALTAGQKITVDALGDSGNPIVSYTKTASDAKYALLGANSDITSLTGLTTPLSAAQGGTGGTGGAAGGYTSIQVFTADGTWTKPAGINLVVVEVVGGGGGGGYGTGSWASSGGGAGGTAIETIDVSAISSETVTVGLGGSGGVGGTSTEPGVSQTAESSSFGAHCSATPGTDQTATIGLIGGIGSGGDLNLRGGASHPGTFPVAAHTSENGGQGGNSSRGAGGIGGNGGAGTAGVHGGGGGGAEVSGDGGDGGDGIVIVWEYT